MGFEDNKIVAVDFDGVIAKQLEPYTGEIGEIIQDAQYYINKLSEPNGIVLDPFCGSGTTLIAAKDNYRQAVGIEINPARANAARQRIKEYYGN